ncbi:unnamed protein product [Chironomus riparius]|uniref:Cytochrome c oxidase assembly protein COX16 homolog, mitochondrial n=1 Tax=Chironomus riparius TaxID=315576 RepID=A0A9N9WP93_9DIPT|nr:unnamed protein product [Chironomus riparius]
MPSFVQTIQYYSKRKLFRFGVPFVLLVVGGSFGLKEFTQLRYQFSRKITVKPDELDKIGIKMKNPEDVTLESEYEKVKNLDIDNWENKRGPRPWEEVQKK